MAIACVTFDNTQYYGYFTPKKTSIQQIIATFAEIYNITNLCAYNIMIKIASQSAWKFNEKSCDKIVASEEQLFIEFLKIDYDTIYKTRDSKLANNHKFNIFINILTGKLLLLNVCSDLTIFELQTLVHDKVGIPEDQQRFIFACQQLEEDKMLSDYNILADNTIHLVLRLRGGMYQQTSGRNGKYGNLPSNVFYVKSDL